jgi:hypothetical protein
VVEFDKKLEKLKKDKASKLTIAKTINDRDIAIRELISGKDWAIISTIFKISKLPPANIGTCY